MPDVADFTLVNKRITLAGRLHFFKKSQVLRRISSAQAVYQEKLTRQSDLLVVGMDGWPTLPNAIVSQTVVKAEQWQAQGHPITIISENVLLERLGLRESTAPKQASCSIERAGRILNVDTITIRRWSYFDLLRIERDQIDFQDLVSLRSVAALIATGSRPAALAKALKQLSESLKTERPLAKARVIREAGDWVAEIQGVRIDTHGQMLLDLHGKPRAPAASVAFQTLREKSQSNKAEYWFNLGQDMEAEEEWLDAAESYQKAIALRPSWPHALYNLGNVYSQIGMLQEAIDQFQRALAADPTMVEAWYNLAYVQDEVADLNAAVYALNQAIHLAPEFADAHFNLARCLELQGHRQKALAHWRRYLMLDPSGPWAEIARTHLHREK